MKINVPALFALAALTNSGVVLADKALNLQQPATELAARVYDLHSLLMWVCLGIFIVVFGAMFYAIIFHRKSVGHKAALFHESTTVEMIWTVIPILILVVLAVPATRLILEQKDTKDADLTIKVTGYQWKWGYEYLDSGIKFMSRLKTPAEQFDGTDGKATAPKNEHYLLEVDNPLVVPVGKKIRVLTTADDVIHSFYVPALAVKLDAIPGFIKDTWFKADKIGTFRGQCTELCGKDHGFMPIVVQVVSQEDYTAWVDSQKQQATANADDPNKVWTMPDMMARGKQVYETNCAVCHKPDGSGMPPIFPALDGSKIAGDPARKADHIHLVLNGKNAMPSWAKQLSDTEIAAAITYERNAWHNKTNDLVQPADVRAAR